MTLKSDRVVREDTRDDTLLGRTSALMVKTSISQAEGLVRFRNSDWREPAQERGKRRVTSLDYQDWLDMGRPDVITVTIEPGDMINV